MKQHNKARSCNFMSQGLKASYTEKQKRQALHIDAGYEKAGLTP